MPRLFSVYFIFDPLHTPSCLQMDIIISRAVDTAPLLFGIAVFYLCVPRNEWEFLKLLISNTWKYVFYRAWYMLSPLGNSQFLANVSDAVCRINIRVGNTARLEYGVMKKTVHAPYPIPIEDYYHTFRFRKSTVIDCRLFYFAVMYLCPFVQTVDEEVYRQAVNRIAGCEDTHRKLVQSRQPFSHRLLLHTMVQDQLPGCTGGYIGDRDLDMLQFWQNSSCNFKGHYIFWCPTGLTVSMSEKGIVYKTIDEWKYDICMRRKSWVSKSGTTLPVNVADKNTPEHLCVYWKHPFY